MPYHDLGFVPSRKALQTVQRLKISLLLHENIPLNPPRNPCANLIRGVSSSGYAKDEIELFQGPLSR